MRLTFILLFFFYLTNTFGQTSISNPPGTIKIKDNLFMDIDELSNSDYRDYLNWLRKVFGENSDKYNKAKPDTTVCPDYYFKNPEAGNYPLVGITYDQAIEYCKWRTDRIFERDLAFKKMIDLDPDQNRDNYFSIENIKKGIYKIDKIKNVKKMQITQFRLPTKEEWELAASGGLDVNQYPFGFKDTTRIKRKLSVERSIQDDIIKTSSFKRGFPNALRISNMIGNVAEMISEKGIAKGGSWKDKLEDCKIQKDVTYTKPTNWLGFRCVCEYKPFEGQ